MEARTGHYMPASLLDSQLRTLERPNTEPDTLILDGARPLDALCAEAERWLNTQREGPMPSRED